MVKKVWQRDRQTDGRTDWTNHIAAWSQLKIIGHLFYATSSVVHNFVAIGEFKLWIQSGNAQSGSNSMIFLPLWPWPLTLIFCVDIMSVNGNNSWKCHDDTMMGTWWKRCNRQTDRRTDWTVLRTAWSQLKGVTDGRTEKQTDRRTDRRTDGLTDRQTDGKYHL